MNEHSNRTLWSMLPQDQVKRVLASNCDIDPEFLGFVGIYQRLAQIIPPDWTVVDLGCAYAPQCFFFDRHAQYIGVDMLPLEQRFHAQNTRHEAQTIAAFVGGMNLDAKRTFAICSYVPPWHGDNVAIARAAFPNVFTYYPAANNIDTPF